MKRRVLAPAAVRILLALGTLALAAGCSSPAAEVDPAPAEGTTTVRMSFENVGDTPLSMWVELFRPGEAMRDWEAWLSAGQSWRADGSLHGAEP